MRPFRSGVIVVAAVIGIVSASVAWATIPGPNGRITACMLKNGTGTIRLIDAAVKQCKSTEKQLQWNAVGSVGAKIAIWDGSLRSDYKPLDNGVHTPLVTLTLPAGFASDSVVATANVRISNWLAEPVWGGCDVYNSHAGTLFTLAHGYNNVSFEGVVSSTGGPLTLRCHLNDVGFNGNPDANGQVWAEVASLSAVPVARP